jgi:hypothetical protein
VFLEIPVARIVFYKLIKLVHVTIIVRKNPRKDWILAEIIETATAEFVDQQQELHVGSLPVFPFVLILLHLVKVFYRVVDQSKVEFFFQFLNIFHKN